MTTSAMEPAGSRERLRQLLDQLAALGVSQRQVAADLGLPSNYVSDVKNGHRDLQEWFAHSFGRLYGVSSNWILTGEGRPQQVKIGAAASQAAALLLPLLSEPWIGEPRDAPSWDGAVIEVSGRAAAAAGAATRPYVLCAAENDRAGRIRSGDLLLVCQAPAEGPPRGAYVLARRRGQLQLALASERGLVSAASGRSLGAAAEVVAHCVGIIWARL